MQISNLIEHLTILIMKKETRRAIYDLNEEECIQLLERVKWKNGADKRL